MHTTNEFDPLNKRELQVAEDTELTDEAIIMAGNREPLSSDEFRSLMTLVAEAIRADTGQGGDKSGCEAIERDPDGFIRELTASREEAIAASRHLGPNAATREVAQSTGGWLQALSSAAWNFTTIPRLACACILLVPCSVLVLSLGLVNLGALPPNEFNIAASGTDSAEQVPGSNSDAARQPPPDEIGRAVETAWRQLEAEDTDGAIETVRYALRQDYEARGELDLYFLSPHIYNLSHDVRMQAKAGNTQRAKEMVSYILRHANSYAVMAAAQSG